ncbi:septum formation family protein [Nocardioides sp. W7]|uniref:septum formation family protein n=1 Tax=Nocardioides sp. W7 TaxID=2931390 RepID=UPI001FD54B60|nr:septum formation family protein [Nocardioides sp. W7]
MRSLLIAAAAAALLAGCAGDGQSPAGPPPSPTPAVLPTATEAPLPPDGACYRLRYAEALAPTNDREPVDCAGRHLSQTFAVGRLDTVVDGHLLAVDSVRVREQVARRCPAALGDFLGGSEEDRRLSMLRAVWFTPTVEASDSGAGWYRCDVIALAGAERLAPVTGTLADVLGRAEGRDRWGMCGTAAPDAPDFARVACSAEHSWRAVSVVDLPPGAYPGAADVREAGQAPCEDAGRDAADDPLDYRWGYEWPTAEQWQAGQTYGRCWAPD